MNIVRFELRKFWRRKLFLWMTLIVFLCLTGMLVQNHLQKDAMKERALKIIQPIEKENDELYRSLQNKPSETQQLEHVNEMSQALFNWKAAILEEEWAQIPKYEHDFLVTLQRYSAQGGTFNALTGTDREKALLKNQWLLKEHMPYVDETYPLVPALFLKEAAAFLWALAGLVLLVLLFGNSFTMEHEQQTWRFLNTQPLAEWKIRFAKFASLVVVIFIYILAIIVLSLVGSWAFGSHTWLWDYPQVIQTGEKVSVITTASYVYRASVLFAAAGIFVFSILLFVSKWLKNTYLALFLTSILVLVGTLYSGGRSLWNPFRVFRFQELLLSLPNEVPLTTLLYGLFIAGLTNWLPSKSLLGGISLSNYMKPFRYPVRTVSFSLVWEVFVFEVQKNWRRGLLRYTLVFLSLMIFIGYYMLSLQTAEKKQHYFKDLSQTITLLEKDIIPTQQMQIDETKKSTQAVAGEEGYIKALTVLKEQLEKGKAAKSAFNNGNWQPLLAYQLFLNRWANKELDSGNIDFDISTLGTFSLGVGIAEKKWLLKHHIQPVISGDFVPTIHSHWEGNRPEKKWLKANEKLDNSGLFSLYHFFQYHLELVLIALLVILFGAGLAGERGKKNTLRFLRTQPLFVRQVFAGKLIYGAVISAFSLIGLIGVVVLTGTFGNRFGDWQYPILQYAEEGRGFNFIPLGVFLLQTALLSGLVLLFTIVLANIVALFCRNTLSVYAVTAIVILAGFFTSTQLADQVAYLSPFTYFNPFKIINGELAVLLNQTRLDWSHGLIVLGTSIILLSAMGTLLLKSK
ncbi:ABC transporter permease subunit [Peribacillus sp. B-H-3]|uniref:ABC transporter permease subunit n=1 Tax=Peribacillus sp. B-H-3 TaxID=3400420 RepID=UPI003B0104FB